MAASNTFDIVETTIADIHTAYENGTLTARQLVQMYLDRIEAISRTLGIKYVFARSDSQPGPLIRGALRSKRQILSHSRHEST